MTLNFSTPTSSQGQEGMMLTAGIPDRDEMAVSKMYNMSAPPVATYSSSEIHLFGLVTQSNIQ
jgi:hypothetical protein